MSQSPKNLFDFMLSRGRILLVAVSLALLLSSSGCVNQQAEIDSWRSVVDEGVKPPQPWVVGQPLTLQEAMIRANHDNEQVALRGESYLQALIEKNRAVAAFLPTVGFQPSYTIEDLPSATPVTGSAPISGSAAPAAATPGGFASSGDTAHRLELPVVGSINVFRGFGDVANLRSADFAILQQRQLLLDSQAVVLLNVAETYFQILRSERQVSVLEHTLELEDARVRDAQIRVKNALALALELSQAKAQDAATRANLAQAQNDVRSGRRMLAYLIAVQSVEGPLQDEVAVPASLPPLAHFQLLALGQRNDLAAQMSAVSAARAAVDAAIAEYYPSVTLNVAGFLYREDFTDASNWDAILIANLPIFSAGIIETDVRNAWSRLRQAALNESLLRRRIERDVQNSYDNVLTSGRKLQSFLEEVSAATDALTQAQQQLANGLAVPLDVLTAQDTLLNAQLAGTSEQFDREVFYLDLLRDAGLLNLHAEDLWKAASPATRPAPVRK